MAFWRTAYLIFYWGTTLVSLRVKNSSFLGLIIVFIVLCACDGAVAQLTQDLRGLVFENKGNKPFLLLNITDKKGSAVASVFVPPHETMYFSSDGKSISWGEGFGKAVKGKEWPAVCPSVADNDIQVFSIFLSEIHWEMAGEPRSIRLSSPKFEYFTRADNAKMKPRKGKIVPVSESKDLIVVLEKSNEVQKKELSGESQKSPNAKLSVLLEGGDTKDFVIYFDSFKCKWAESKAK